MQQRIGEIDQGWTTHPSLGLATAVSTLLSNLRGGVGWGDDPRLPLDYNPKGERDNRKLVLVVYDGGANREEFYFPESLKASDRSFQVCSQQRCWNESMRRWEEGMVCRFSNNSPGPGEERRVWMENSYYLARREFDDQRYRGLCKALSKHGICIFGGTVNGGNSSRDPLQNPNCISPYDSRVVNGRLNSPRSEEELVKRLLESGPQY
ncbi:hypothetical protein [Pseudomonas aeruginosa]|uniref:hypothetical protein n=1 Tax=Pseudomonas aeruginosa TaxID=287 RepID=UPI0034D1F00E